MQNGTVKIDGESVPEIRFAGFTGVWEVIKIDSESGQ